MSAYLALSASFESEGAGDYLGEQVSMAEHMLQTAAAARADGASADLVVAALTHDVGHFTGVLTGRDLMAGDDNRHDEAAATWLAQWFGPSVTEPVRLHVLAKRYLCAVEPDYYDRLSPASQHTMAVQGGVMTAAEAEEFERRPYALDAVALRRYDDIGKDPGARGSRLADFRADVDALDRTLSPDLEADLDPGLALERGRAR